MDILLQSRLDRTRSSSPSFHIRYYEIRKPGEEAQVPHQLTAATMKSSHIIVRSEYAYLESMIRETYQDAQDVRVYVDRRCGERRKACDRFAGEDLRISPGRRQSTPILDVVISLEGTEV